MVNWILGIEAKLHTFNIGLRIKPQGYSRLYSQGDTILLFLPPYTTIIDLDSKFFTKIIALTTVLH